jgi:hypothetical protein
MDFGSTSNGQHPRISVREMTLDDVPAVCEVQRRAFAANTCGLEKLECQVRAFPEGQHVAVDQDGRILGCSSSLIIDWDDYSESANWAAITGGGVPFATAAASALFRT